MILFPFFTNANFFLDTHILSSVIIPPKLNILSKSAFASTECAASICSKSAAYRRRR
jgi:hypothetical protein